MAPPRAAKRAKLVAAPPPPPERGEDDYVAGNIVEIELCNFITYDRLVCRPGPRLNLVVGPNGSGKSSLVCAVALGLAGEPNILGRASSVGAFVKRGEVAGHVKISLRGETPDDRICITRKIDTENKSEWLLNGAIVLKKEVIDIIKKFNIQVNNLTQFLPQDRVSEFAKLSPIQLLEETEKAVGDPDLPVQHRQLVERSKELKALEVALKQKEHTLNNLKALNAEHEKDVERIRLRDNLLRKAELMKKKLPWLKFDKMKKEFEDVVQKQEKTAKEKMEEAARIWDDAKRPIEYSFITQDAYDRDYMVGQMKKYGIPVLNKVVDEGIRRRPLDINLEMKKLGIYSRLDQVFDAPNTVKDVLISQAILDDSDFLIEAVALKWSHTEKQMAAIELNAKIWEMEKGVNSFEKLEKDANMAARDYEDCKRMTQEYKMKLSMVKRHAESITKITRDLAKEFLEMPDTVEDLEAAIQDNESEANSMLFLNQNVLQEYLNRQHKIESISNKLNDDKDQYDICCSEIETVKGKWLPTLRTLVSKINETFSRNFQEMAVAGEVSLDEHGVDFDHYSILIKVKFRQTSQLQVLSAHHQSGGERSVSTILYLVSLQDLTNCPFRVVDEINQGKATVIVPNPSTVCFLLTPKLLPDLEYSDACSILNIMNGPWIEEPAKVWSTGDCWRTVMSTAGHY
nr:unnamed protein product [Digitaria exilis]